MKKLRNKKIFYLFTLIFLGLVFGVVKNIEAAYTGSSPTWASTADYASVNSCITQAADPTKFVDIGT